MADEPLIVVLDCRPAGERVSAERSGAVTEVSGVQSKKHCVVVPESAGPRFGKTHTSHGHKRSPVLICSDVA